ncbi:MAG: hypothetical protein U9R72_07720, partial [Chloroflexota bacterium]|nr:hypothetical protein [Chloroflexota bacterium]
PEALCWLFARAALPFYDVGGVEDKEEDSVSTSAGLVEHYERHRDVTSTRGGIGRNRLNREAADRRKEGYCDDGEI